MNRYFSIHPDRKLAIARFTGPIDYQDIQSWIDEAMENEAFSNDYDGVLDLRGAELKETRLEKARFLASYVIERDFTTGRWVVMVSKPMETALALVYGEAASQKHPVKIVSTLPAAAAFLGKDLSDLGLDEPAGRAG